MSQQKEYSLKLGEQTLTFKTGLMAGQTNATVLCQLGDTVTMSNITMSARARDIDFLPLQLVYQEKYYAGGVIGGGRFRKREGRPADDAILKGRIIDRGLRPMFNKALRRDVQVFCTVVSYDNINDHDVTSANAANLGVAISDCPCESTLGSVRVGMINGELVLNPTHEQREHSDLDLFLTSSPDTILMIDVAANELPEEDVLRGIEFGKEWAQKIAVFFQEIQAEIGMTKIEVEDKGYSEEAYNYLKDLYLADVQTAMRNTIPKLERRALFGDMMDQGNDKLLEKYGDVTDDMDDEAKEAHKALLSSGGKLVDKVIKAEVRRAILEDGVRMNGRKPTEIRPLSCMVDVLPARVHGSALFTRGETQGLCTCTLGGPGDKQLVEGMEGEKQLRYMHHYNFPPFSVGETSNRLFVGNREVGHGMLAQKALEPVLPTEEEFPYTIRTVTEILSSNGSSSMAAACGSTLALMAAGVPLKRPVSGIAMGLMSDSATGNYVILSDLQDEEDFGGDMDFKVTGTANGITAIQMDIKIKGLPDVVFKEALEQAKVGRMVIMDSMLAAIPEYRKEMSAFAPRIESIQINTDDIRLVIGKGGETIQKITKDLNVEIDINDDGMVSVTAVDGDSMTKALEWIQNIVAKPEVDKKYKGKVTRIIDGIGAIVEILPGKDGMVHISELQWGRTENVQDIVKEGEEVEVICFEYDAANDKTKLSIKRLTSPPEGYVERAPRPRSPRPGGGAPRRGSFNRR